MTNQNQPESEKQTQIESVIIDAIQAVEFGSISIIIHNGRVVQIEKTQKFRY